MIRTKRIYDPPAPDDGTRFLVERLWPRGKKREDVPIAAWLKEVAPGDALRRWFGHDPARWEEFQQRYFAELEQPGNPSWRRPARATSRCFTAPATPSTTTPWPSKHTWISAKGPDL